MVRLRRGRNRRNENTDPHRYQPFARLPPQHPNTAPKLKKPVDSDSRDDVAVARRPLSRRDLDDNGGYSSDGSINTLTGRPYRNNDPITVVTVSLKQCLKLQKLKLGPEHPNVTKALHSLALEYKMQGKLSKSVILLREAIELLDSRLFKLINEEDVCDEDDYSLSSTETRISVLHATRARKIQMIRLLEEKSVIYSCLGNIYRMRKLHREAMDYYVRSCDMLVEAGYSGESKRVSMMVRIMRRLEAERLKKPPVSRTLPVIQRVDLSAL